VVPAQAGCFKAPEVLVTTSNFIDPVTGADAIVFETAATAFGDTCQIAALDITQVDGDPSVDLVFDAFGQGQTSFTRPAVETTTTLTFEVRATDSDGNTSVTTVPVNITPDGESNDGPDPSASIEGIWVFPDVAPEDLHIIFRADGSYFMHQGFYFGENVELGDGDYCAGGGSESGTFERNLTTGQLTVTLEFDENGECGLSNPRGGLLTVTSNGDQLFIEEPAAENGETFIVERFAGSTPPTPGPVASIVGRWAFQGVPGEDIFFNLNADGTWRFFNSGRFEEGCDDARTDNSGTYSWDRASTIADFLIQTTDYGECTPGDRLSPGDMTVNTIVPNKDGTTMILITSPGDQFILERIE
jgi:hypothetical protein